MICQPPDEGLSKLGLTLDQETFTMNLFRTCIILSFLLPCHGVQSQERLEIPVKHNEKELIMPWAGGFNAPQFSNIDLNRDGVLDMITFDRQGDVLRTYVRLPASGRWIWDPAYESSFPDLVDWVLIADFDQDGIEDLFTSSSGSGAAGIKVFKGNYSEDQWSFTLVVDRDRPYLQVPAGNGLANLYVSWDDIPAIRDMDGDGDQDVLAFEPGGSYITLFTNRSVENGWGLDSLRFEVEDICWGKILENELSETVYLSDDPQLCSDGNFTGNGEIEPRHAGSTVMALDVDFDGDQDAFVGDITSRRLVFLLNGLNVSQAWITEQDSHFPSQDTSVNLPYFVSAYSVQVDDDPEPELLAAINSRSLTEDKVGVWRYDDDPFTDGPLLYALEEKGFFQNEMIDMGSHSRPAVADVNGDGLQDLVIGGYRYTDQSNTRLPSLWLFENRGSLTQPYFELVNDDFLGMSQFASIPSFEFAPAFGDIDGQGGIDLIVGEQNGKLFFFQNMAPADSPMEFQSAVYPYMNIAVGVSSVPQMADINGDGLADLIVGERTGNSDQNGRCSNLNYFENIGTAGMALFNSDVTLAPNTQCFGRVLFDIPAGLPQYSTPSVVRTQEGWVLMSGNDNGELLLYTDLQMGKTGAITLLDPTFGSLDVGNRSAPTLADLNGDGLFELLVGNQRGGVELYGTPLMVGVTGVTDPDDTDEKSYVIESEPLNGIFDIRFNVEREYTVRVYDVRGQLVLEQNEPNPYHIRIRLTDQPPGVYLVELISRQQRWIEKLVRY